jgi:extracellular elastinolytic metalloproteinase
LSRGRGNNVVSYQGDTSSTTSQSSDTLNFNYAMDATTKDPADNIDAARVNAFYIANTVHDFFYRYGFTEVAFNFQQYNFNRGGQEGDRVLLSVQHDDLTDNAKFTTPAE